VVIIMANGTIEAALYDISTKGSIRKRFAEDPAAALQMYRLQPDELAEIATLDVAALIARGINPMLTMGLWIAINGPQTLPKYIGTLAQSAKA
jgi:hypothetical protein